MKCDISKLNNFFDSNIDDDIKKFVRKLLKIRTKQSETYVDSYLYDLGFYTSDYLEHYNNDNLIINFYVIKKIRPEIRKFIFSQIIEEIKIHGELPDNDDDFFSDLEIFIEYSDWVKNKRKYKLLTLNEK